MLSPPPSHPPHKAEVGRAWQLVAAVAINKDRAPGWTGCSAPGMRVCGSECLQWEEAMRTELQLESRSSDSEREVGAYSNPFNSPFDQAIAFWGVGGVFRSQIKVTYNSNDFYLVI